MFHTIFLNTDRLNILYYDKYHNCKNCNYPKRTNSQRNDHSTLTNHGGKRYLLICYIMLIVVCRLRYLLICYISIGCACGAWIPSCGSFCPSGTIVFAAFAPSAAPLFAAPAALPAALAAPAAFAAPAAA